MACVLVAPEIVPPAVAQAYELPALAVSARVPPGKQTVVPPVIVERHEQLLTAVMPVFVNVQAAVAENAAVKFVAAPFAGNCTPTKV